MSSSESFFLAPLQGFTDFVFRRCYHQVFGDIDEFYIPYISIGPGHKIRNSQYRDVLPENNEGVPVVPQILCANADEVRFLASKISELGYQKINLNLGCPYPMATKRGRGTGLLEKPDELRDVLDCLFSEYNFQVSVKFRSGLSDEQAIFNQIDLLQEYPFTQLIYHPRTAVQLYKGNANQSLFAELSAKVKIPLVHNGDIKSPEDIDAIKKLVPTQTSWMIGRGILNDPFLVGRLKGNELELQTQNEIKWEFHQSVLESYRSIYQDEGHVLMKMKQFWSYFANGFSNPSKTYKPIKKATKLKKFLEVYPAVFRNEPLVDN